MSNLSKYSGSYAKVCAMKSKLFKKSDYEHLIACSSIGGIIDFLKKTEGYGEVLKDVSEANTDVTELEALIGHAADRDLINLQHFMNADGKRFMSILVMKKEIEVLKRILRSVYSGTEYVPDKVAGFLESGFTIDAEKLASSVDIYEFIDNLEGTRYYRLISQFRENPEHLRLFKLEMVLDCYYYKYAWEFTSKSLKGIDKEIITKFLGSEIDVCNIMWIVRCKRYYNIPKELIYSFMIPVSYRLKKERIIAMAESRTEDILYDEIAKTPYAGVFGGKDDDFEKRWASSFIRDEAKAAKLNPFSIFAVVEFCHEKDNEIKNVIKITEAIRYDVDKSEIMNYLTMKGGE